MSNSQAIKTVITNCAAAACFVPAPSRFVISLLIMDELKAAGLENSPENNRTVQDKLDNVTGLDLPAVGSMIEFDNGGLYNVGGVVEEIDYNYEVVCVNDDYGNPCQIPFSDF
jgi:uncharacterized protein YkvS